MLAVSEILMPVKASASGILGVITSASGNKYLINAETACLTATHIVPGVFKMKVTFELLDSESADQG